MGIRALHYASPILSMNGSPAGVRTRNLPLSKRVLCPIELQGSILDEADAKRAPVPAVCGHNGYSPAPPKSWRLGG